MRNRIKAIFPFFSFSSQCSISLSGEHGNAILSYPHVNKAIFWIIALPNPDLHPFPTFPLKQVEIRQ
jgi:hypothetical protein